MRFYGFLAFFPSPSNNICVLSRRPSKMKRHVYCVSVTFFQISILTRPFWQYSMTITVISRLRLFEFFWDTTLIVVINNTFGNLQRLSLTYFGVFKIKQKYRQSEDAINERFVILNSIFKRNWIFLVLFHSRWLWIRSSEIWRRVTPIICKFHAVIQIIRIADTFKPKQLSCESLWLIRKMDILRK